MVQRGAVQCYEGNVNSHTHIQLGVDPSEKFVMSGYSLKLLNIFLHFYYIYFVIKEKKSLSSFKYKSQ